MKQIKTSIICKKTKIKHLIKHQTKRHTFIKFLLILLIFITYFIFITQKYGIQQGRLVSLLTRSFFVLCTPIADAGFLIDFPLRIITKFKMIFIEIFVRILAIGLNTYTIITHPEIYQTTTILKLFHQILTNISPFGAIIVISMIGTFVSIKFGDSLMDKIKYKDVKNFKIHKKNYKLYIMIILFVVSIFIYKTLLKKLGITIF